MVTECFIECHMESRTYRNRPSKVITVFTVILSSTWKDDKPKLREVKWLAWGHTASLHCRDSNLIPLSGCLFSCWGRYVGMRAESLYGFQPRQWKLYPWLVSLPADPRDLWVGIRRTFRARCSTPHLPSLWHQGGVLFWLRGGWGIHFLSFVQKNWRLTVCILTEWWLLLQSYHENWVTPRFSQGHWLMGWCSGGPSL